MDDGNALWIYVVFQSPADYPGKFVVRVQRAGKRGVEIDADPLIVCNTLPEARAVIPGGLYRMNRNPQDVPSILEVWL